MSQQPSSVIGWVERAYAAEAENTRLRAALEAVAALDGGYPDDYCAIARAALAGEPTCTCNPRRPEGRSWEAHQPGCPLRVAALAREDTPA